MTNPIDTHVGMRIRARRQQLKLSQMQLAPVLEVSFQQLQKYETGANRISASKLFMTANALEVPVGWFFEGLGES
jgi:transcriptional regulator with XRE-family HTH domain